MRRGKGRNGLLPNSLRIISSCLKTVSSNAGSVASTVRSAGASVAASIAVPAEEEKDQVRLDHSTSLFCAFCLQEIDILVSLSHTRIYIYV